MQTENPKNALNWLELESLFQKYMDGSASASNELFKGILKVLKGYFRARMGKDEDIEDLAQATLLKIHFSRDRYDSKLALKTWVFTIASRTLIDHWRGAHSNAEKVSDEIDDHDDSLASIELTPEEKTQLHQDINKGLIALKPIERSIVYLYGVEGLSMAEIAEIHSISEGAVKIRAHRAYQELRKLLVMLALIQLSMEIYGRN